MAAYATSSPTDSDASDSTTLYFKIVEGDSSLL
jgi:hypothetical protein